MDNIKLNWYNEFNNNLNLSKYNNIDDYINKLKNQNNNKNIENKISLIEQDYFNKIDHIHDLYNNSNNIKILKTKNSLIILQKELEIIKILTKYTLQNKTLDYDFFKLCLTLLLDLSETLKKRLGQKDIIHDNIKKKNKYFEDNKINESNLNDLNLLNTNKNDDDINGNINDDIIDDINNNTIARCSYKFCSYKEKCSYNYNLKSKNLCYQDHYVHNMVSADLKILLKYIDDKYNNSKIILHTKEILKTINTLSFVISHMECELKSKCLYQPENEWESFHIVKNK
uniref:Uncharacterized protein n=1 Tax=viral metagenome TaxID=1070528 RepID=A0A6C0EES4_9ZZZZ